jgi:hypothetical protein
MMQTVSLYLAFFAIWIGSVLLMRDTVRLHYGADSADKLNTTARMRFRTWLLIWLAIATVLSVLAFLNPAVRLPGFVIPASVVLLALAYGSVLRKLTQHQGSNSSDAWRVALGLQRWRAYFGGLILLGGALSLLPWSFALAAGLGDIFVGLWAMWLHRLANKQGRNLSLTTIYAFTILGVADLINAGRLGGAVVLPWLIERNMPGFILLLPLFGVPIMLVTHFWILRSKRLANDGAQTAHGLKFMA